MPRRHTPKDAITRVDLDQNWRVPTADAAGAAQDKPEVATPARKEVFPKGKKTTRRQAAEIRDLFPVSRAGVYVPPAMRDNHGGAATTTATPRVWILTGFPFCGKTEWIGEQIKKGAFPEGTVFISTDKFIDQEAEENGTTYTEMFKQGAYKRAEKSMYEEVAAAIQAKQCVVWDQTNLSRFSRMNKLKLFPAEYTRISVYVPKPEDDATWAAMRASRPDKVIDDKALKEMARMFTVPIKAEGFDVMVQVDPAYIVATAAPA